MGKSTHAFEVSALYSNEDIYKSLRVGNTGGVRTKLAPDGQVERVAIFTSFPTQRQIAENPYHDRLEGEVLIYTGAGKAGDQVISGPNARILQQLDKGFPIYAFTQVASRRNTSVGNKRWGFLGLVECLRCYQERQVDSSGKLRNALVFELRVHSNPSVVPVNVDAAIMKEILANCPKEEIAGEREIADSTSAAVHSSEVDLIALESIRRRLLAFDPRQFEIFIRDLLVHSGFEQVEVTKYSQDGGIDLNARTGLKSWPLRHLLVQIQAKRWLHTVGRREVAELRGSLSPHAAGCIVTTSHFSRAALLESSESGKAPITVINGCELAGIVHSLNFSLVPDFTHKAGKSCLSE